MKGWRKAFLTSVLVLAASILLVTHLCAQEEVEVPSAALGGAALVFFLLVAIPLYVYLALCLQTIAKKTNTPNAWMAWIPIVNIFLMLNIARKPAWWFILCLLPLVNIIIVIIVWMAIAEARGKPNWWGILMIVPFFNLIVPGYLAFSD